MPGKHIIIIGPPGSGKGTQAARIAEKMDIRHLSTGDLLRDAVAAGSPLGLEAKGFMEKGLLVPDELILGLIKAELESSGDKGWILDGFPRTLPQASALSGMLGELGAGIDHVIEIEVDPAVVVGRVSGRRVCEECKAVYNVSGLEEGETACRKCGGKLVKRPDDEEETILRRFDVYRKQTEPVLEYYAINDFEIVKIDGSGDIDGITAEIIREVR